MKLPIYSQDKKQSGDVELPRQFEEQYRPDVIARAVRALRSRSRQPYGASPQAGMRHSAELSKRRRKYRGSYGFGISRVNRKIHTRRGTRFFWVGATSPQTRGGRRAHAPKAQKQFAQALNKKENRLAIRSAVAATVNKELVQARGHKIPDIYPFVISNDVETLSKTSDVRKALEALGFGDELARSSVKKVRAGIGKLRGRKYRKRKGLLLVVGEDCPLAKAARNIAGLDVVAVHALNAHVLAPGSLPGRATLFTQNAVEKMKGGQLFA